MSRMRINLACAAVTLAGGVLLGTTPAQAAEPVACSDAQKAYMRQVAYSVCGSGGGTTYATCNGANIMIEGVVCN